MFKNSHLTAILFSLSFISSNIHASSEPVWFQAKMSQCVQSVHKWIDKEDPKQDTFKKDMNLDYAKGGSISLGFKGAEVGFSFPGIGLSKLKMPGAGFCCVYDDKGNQQFAQMVLKGNDECWSNLRMLKNEANDKKSSDVNKMWHGGLYWCKGPEANCFMDWWHEYHVK